MLSELPAHYNISSESPHPPVTHGPCTIALIQRLVEYNKGLSNGAVHKSTSSARKRNITTHSSKFEATLSSTHFEQISQDANKHCHACLHDFPKYRYNQTQTCTINRNIQSERTKLARTSHTADYTPRQAHLIQPNAHERKHKSNAHIQTIQNTNTCSQVSIIDSDAILVKFKQDIDGKTANLKPYGGRHQFNIIHRDPNKQSREMKPTD